MPACTTPELWPVWCAASRSSFSSTTTSVPGRRRTTSRAMATPRMPPPTTPTRCSPMGETLAPGTDAVKHRGRTSHNGGMRDLHVPAGPGLPEGLVVPAVELVERFSRSPGPGGQSVNTTDSRVELEYDVASSTALSDAQRARALRRWPSGRVTIAASEHRSQHRNRVAARERLADLLRQALAPPPPPRRPTRPSRASQQRRVEAKRRRGETKALRRPLRDV